MTREEAINKVQQMSLPKETMEIFQALAPELAASEDEKIKKTLIDALKTSKSVGELKFILPEPTREECLAYLEKQKECVSNNFDDVWAEEDCEEIIAEGQKLTPRFKELLKEVCHAWYDRGAKLEKQKSGLSFVGDFQAKTLQGPIELAEWKEAAKIREWILAKMQELAATGVPCSDEIKMADKAIDYLIKQKEYIEEPKIAFRDWGDKEKKEAIITCLKYMRFIKKITNQEYDDLIKWLANNTISNVSEKEECLREVKQKEQKPLKVGENAYFDPNTEMWFIKKEQKPAEWSEEDKRAIDRACVALRAYANGDLPEFLPSELIGYADRLQSLRSQPKQEWSEEDEKMLQSIIKDFRAGKVSTIGQERWLKSLRPQQRQEWSDEEKEILDSILSHYVLIDKPTDANGIPKEKYISLIKSLRFDTFKNCNSHWKPSEEQMKALNEIVNILAASPFFHQNDYLFNILNGLREELKKLL